MNAVQSLQSKIMINTRIEQFFKDAWPNDELVCKAFQKIKAWQIKYRDSPEIFQMVWIQPCKQMELTQTQVFF